MNQKELAKAFMMILKWNNPLVSMVYTKFIQRCKNYVSSDQWRLEGIKIEK